jgi:hypothetical protein
MNLLRFMSQILLDTFLLRVVCVMQTGINFCMEGDCYCDL